MKRVIILSLLTFTLTGCYHESAMQLGNDLMEIDVSAAPVYGRAGATDMAYKRAAVATIKAGYDKFIVVNNAGWNESSVAGGSYAQATTNNMQGQASGGSYFGSFRNPEVKIIIHMFHNGDEGSEKAVDARAILKQTETQ